MTTWRDAQGRDMRYVPVEERFWPRVNKTETCWLWTGPLFDGYGRIKINGVCWKVYRLAYTWEHGPIPDGMTIDHKCRNRACVRPSHLQVASRAENSQNLGVRADNTSGVRGVSWRPRHKSWAVRAVGNDGQRVWGGLYKTLPEAEAAAIELRNRIMSNNLQDRRTA